MISQDLRFSNPSALRNRVCIFEVLENVLPTTGKVLEVASGSGEHVTYFAEQFPNLIWQPSDPSKKARESIETWLELGSFPNVMPPLDLDVTQDVWSISQADAMLAINMVHISPWSATQGLLNGAGRLLPVGGTLTLYGPYRREGEPFAKSNAEFDDWLRSENPNWGVRHLEEVTEEAEKYGLSLLSTTEMPANNLAVTFSVSKSDRI